MTQIALQPAVSPRLTNLCAWFSLLVAVALPLLVGFTWMDARRPSYWAGDIGAPPADHLRPLGATLAIIPPLLLGWGLLLANRCLRRFGRGEFFTSATVADLRGFARWTFYGAVAGLLAPTVIGLVLTILNTAGPKELTLRIGSQEIVALLMSGVFWIMAGVLARAAEVADENRQFV